VLTRLSRNSYLGSQKSEKEGRGEKEVQGDWQREKEKEVRVGVGDKLEKSPVLKKSREREDGLVVGMVSGKENRNIL
jgi:hypothetical protein